MKYQSILYVVASANKTAISIETDLGSARQAANQMALNNPGCDYSVYEWRNGTLWQEHKTHYSYRGFVIPNDDRGRLAQIAADIKTIRDAEWGRLDSERGHANMQTAHNQLANYK